jgi:hypothetical protein
MAMRLFCTEPAVSAIWNGSRVEPGMTILKVAAKGVGRVS